jgi:hypothetical protein
MTNGGLWLAMSLKSRSEMAKRRYQRGVNEMAWYGIRQSKAMWRLIVCLSWRRRIQ